MRTSRFRQTVCSSQDFRWKGSSLENIFWFLQNQRHFAIRQCKLQRATCRRFDTIPACDGRTHGQTDGNAIASTTPANIAARCKNGWTEYRQRCRLGCRLRWVQRTHTPIWWGPWVGTPAKKIGFGVFCGSDPTKILLKEIQYQQNRHQERLAAL